MFGNTNWTTTGTLNTDTNYGHSWVRTHKAARSIDAAQVLVAATLRAEAKRSVVRQSSRTLHAVGVVVVTEGRTLEAAAKLSEAELIGFARYNSQKTNSATYIIMFVVHALNIKNKYLRS